MNERVFSIAVWQDHVRQRRAELAEQGIVLPTDDELRNTGGRRTEAKRDLLRRMEARAKEAGITPTKRFY
jgi:hypothetical protein